MKYRTQQATRRKTADNANNLAKTETRYLANLTFCLSRRQYIWQFHVLKISSSFLGQKRQHKLGAGGFDKTKIRLLSCFTAVSFQSQSRELSSTVII